MKDSCRERVVKPRERALVGDLGTNPITKREEDGSKANGLEGNQPKGSIESQRGGRSSPRPEEGTRGEGSTPMFVEELSGIKRYNSVPAHSILSLRLLFLIEPFLKRGFWVMGVQLWKTKVLVGKNPYSKHLYGS